MINYDPLRGLLQRTGRPMNSAHPTQWKEGQYSVLRIIRELAAPGSSPYPQPKLLRQGATSSLALAHLRATSARDEKAPLVYTFPGIGLLPFDPVTHKQFIPQPLNQGMKDAWGGRKVCIYTGRVQHQKSSENTQFKLQHTNPKTGRLAQGTVYRAKVVAAAALGLHPLTPVMAWYIGNPEKNGYGIDNIFTPLEAGAFRYSRYAPPPQPYETEPHNMGGLTIYRPRYVYTPHAQLDPDDWPWPEPPKLISDLL